MTKSRHGNFQLKPNEVDKGYLELKDNKLPQNIKDLVDKSKPSWIERIYEEVQHWRDKGNAVGHSTIDTTIPEEYKLGFGQVTVPLLLIINEKLDIIIKYFNLKI